MKIKMNLINPESLNQIKGGEAGSCNKTGDTIACNIVGKIINCATAEVNCKGEFSSSCENISSFTVSGCTSVSISS